MHLALVGCGHLGQALLQRWLDERLTDRISVIDLSLPDDPDPRATWTTDVNDALTADAVVFAVRPPQMAEALTPWRTTNTLTISVAAGWTVASIAGYRGDAPIIRTMPNLPAQIGMGMTALYANHRVTPSQRAFVDRLFHTVGDAVWIDDEKFFEPITALSGSGPAYIFFLTQVMSEAGVHLGLPADLAKRLARQTVYGAAQFMQQSAQTPEALCQAVQSRGGTTEAAFTRLLGPDGLKPMILEAMRRATARAAEIGKAVA